MIQGLEKSLTANKFLSALMSLSQAGSVIGSVQWIGLRGNSQPIDRLKPIQLNGWRVFFKCSPSALSWTG